MKFLMLVAPCAAVIYYKADDPECHECEEEAHDEIECDICGFKSTDPDGAHYCCEDNSDD